MCGRDTDDPLAQRLFREEGLCLVRVARTPEELSPEKSVVTYPGELKRPPVIYDLAELFQPLPQVGLEEAPYAPLPIQQSSNELSIGLLGTLSGFLGGGVEPQSLELALRATGATSFKVKFNGGQRRELKLGRFEPQFRKASLTETGRDLHERGARLHLVTRTVTAQQVELRSTENFRAGVDADFAGLATLGVAVRRKSASTLVMERLNAGMVVGFQALRVMVNNDGLALRGLHEPMRVLGADPEPQVEDPSEFAETDSMFAAPELRSDGL